MHAYVSMYSLVPSLTPLPVGALVMLTAIQPDRKVLCVLTMMLKLLVQPNQRVNASCMHCRMRCILTFLQHNDR